MLTCRRTVEIPKWQLGCFGWFEVQGFGFSSHVLAGTVDPDVHALYHVVRLLEFTILVQHRGVRGKIVETHSLALGGDASLLIERAACGKDAKQFSLVFNRS